MKKFLLLTICILTITILAAQNWVQKNNFPGVERYGATGFEINGKLYMGTGYNGVTFMNDWWEYDPSSDQWTQKASLPGAGRFHTTSFVINGKGYIVFGATNTSPYNFIKELWEYDPLLNQWTQKASCPGLARYTAVGFALNGKGYAGTGWKQISPAFLNDWWEYNPLSNSWTQKASFPGGSRQAASSFILNGTGYVGLGGAGSTMYSDLWAYNQINNTWTQKATFIGSPRTGAASFELDEFGYIGTGNDGEFGNSIHTDYFKYNPISNSWSTVTGFTPGRLSPVAVSIEDCAYILTGLLDNIAAPQNALIDFWEFCLSTEINDSSSPFSNLNLYPNPTTNLTYLEFTCEKSKNVNVELVDITGKIINNIFQGNIISGENYKFAINNNLSRGIYTLKITLGNEIINKHFIKLD